MNASIPIAPSSLPVIDMGALLTRDHVEARREVARRIAAACRDSGFFYVVGHGVDSALLEELEREARLFFALPDAEKKALSMDRGGRAWRGYFPVGGELTSGRPDIKEGLYLGTELPSDHPRVVAGWPLHGANLWPVSQPSLRGVVQRYMDATVRAAHALLEGVALSLGLADDWFASHYTREPTVLFRLFHYPASPPSHGDFRESWGVGEHTDYGLLTLLAQDTHGGLQVKTPRGWCQAPPIPGSLVCNIGDMLDRLTGGHYRSTPHRVMNVSGHDRLSFPLFFDPDMAARVTPLPSHAGLVARSIDADHAERWDGGSVHVFDGSYGDYLLGKVGQVFPQLRASVL